MNLVSQIGALLSDQRATLSTAESCTGGLLGHLLTNQPGSSNWYVGGIVSYSNDLKHGLLAVRRDTLEAEGAVSAAVAAQMALGARQAFDTDYAISVTGIAGPGGGTEEKPVGLTFIGVATPDQVIVRRFVWTGCRQGNKQSSATAAFELLYEILEKGNSLLPGAAVEASFEPDGKILPLALTWNGRSLRVTDRGRQWEKDGKRIFLVMTPGDEVWELCFDPAAVRWSITPKSHARQLA
jgi:PncC family amidohydrolase